MPVNVQSRKSIIFSSLLPRRCQSFRSYSLRNTFYQDFYHDARHPINFLNGWKILWKKWKVMQTKRQAIENRQDEKDKKIPEPFHCCWSKRFHRNETKGKWKKSQVEKWSHAVWKWNKWIMLLQWIYIENEHPKKRERELRDKGSESFSFEPSKIDYYLGILRNAFTIVTTLTERIFYVHFFPWNSYASVVRTPTHAKNTFNLCAPQDTRSRTVSI